MSYRRRALLVLASAGLALLIAPSALAQTRLNGKVGPGFTISVTDASGAAVRHVPAGTYEIRVEDTSELHSFHLTGPGVNMSTDPEFVGVVTWTITLADGIYTFFCDVHPTQMRGRFAVGTATLPPPPPPPPARLTAVVGPGKTIALRTASGARVRFLQPGTYRITVRDRTRTDNFHLIGAGVNRKTRVPFRGTVTWTVRFAAGKTYVYRSDARRTLRGSFRVRAGQVTSHSHSSAHAAGCCCTPAACC